MPARSVLAIAAAGLSLLGLSITSEAATHPQPDRAEHVLLISVDGLHESDLAYYVGKHPQSALARLVARGTDYTHARTTLPSDSFPGMVAQLTGGESGTTGVYYDDTYNHDLLPPGTVDCTSVPRGTEVAWTEAADRSQNPITLDPSALPVSPATCLPMYPHDYIRVNTVFDVARAAGLRTAWSDKHPAYEILDGPSGTGVQDLFAPEINSVADAAGDDWTTDNALTEEYDGFKVAAVLNEIDGLDHSGTRPVGTPAVFGLNFQTVSTGQKLPTSDGLRGGYNADGTPGPLLSRSLDYVDAQIGAMMQRIDRDGLASSTTIILSAKHGQSPIDPNLLRRVDDGAIIAALDAGWASTHPDAAPLVAFSVDDDAMLLWLSDRSPAALAFADQYLLTHSAPANTIDDPKGVHSATVAASGLTAVYTGAGVDHLLGAPAGDSHAPDLFGIAQHGVVYTGGVKKIAEHGGAAADDRDVALVVSGTGAHPGVESTPVQTTQIAPTILRLLGLSPRALQAVRADHTPVLP